MTVESTQDDILQMIAELLCGAYFEGYTFDTSFTLRFGRSRSENPRYPKQLPIIELYLLGDWWFYSDKEWDERLSVMKGLNAHALTEPLQAFELTVLRWCGDSEVCAVSIVNNVLEIEFKNERNLYISCAAIEGESWVLLGKEEASKNSVMSITCEDGKYYNYFAETM